MYHAPSWCGEVKINFDGYAKNGKVAGVGVLSQNKLGIVLLTKDWMLTGLTMSLTELTLTGEAIRVAFFGLHRQSVWLERDSIILMHWL